MNDVLRLALVDPHDSQRESLKSMLLGMEGIWFEAECSSYQFFADMVAQTNPEIGLVSIDADPQQAMELIARLSSASPDCAVLVVSWSDDNSLILQAMRAGAREFLTQPLQVDDMQGALKRIGERRFGRGGDNRPRSNQVIAVAGAKGGVGTTSLAINLGCILARDAQNSVALVDLDLCRGDADVFLDTSSDYTLTRAIQDITRLDVSLLKRSLKRHSSGLYVLPRPAPWEDVARITPDDLQRVIELLKGTFTHLVLDLSLGDPAIDLTALTMATHILLATQIDLSCLRNIVRLMTSFGNMDGLANKVKIVVNRVGLENGKIELKRAEETIGKEFYWQLPNDYHTMIEARNNGVPVIENKPRAAIAQSLVALAKALSDNGTAQTADAGLKKGLGRLCKLWPSKRRK